MTNLITLTIPNDDHIALRAFGKALEEMALAHGAEPRKTTVGEMTYKLNIDTTVATAALERINNIIAEHPELEVDTTAQQVESLVQNQQPLGEDFEKVLTDNIGELYVESTPTIDSTNTLWDERIHSASKALNADGTWRLRRKPKDMDDAEWSDYVTMIKADLQYPVECGGEEPEQYVEDSTEVQSVDPVACQNAIEVRRAEAEQPEPPVTPPGDDFHTDAGVVTEQTVAGIPPIPVPPPVVVPPVPVADEVWTFPKLMVFLTNHNGKISIETVNQILSKQGMQSLKDLNGNENSIPAFVRAVQSYLETESASN